MPAPLLRHLYKDLKKKICQYLLTILLLLTVDQTLKMHLKKTYPHQHIVLVS